MTIQGDDARCVNVSCLSREEASTAVWETLRPRRLDSI